KDHYERKYLHESDITQIDAIEATGIPTSRFTAVVQFFPKYFRGGDVLEIGAGSGHVAKTLLLSDSRINTYTLGDISTVRVEAVRRNVGDGRVNAIELDAESISESEYGKYDAVIMMALIEHLIDPLGAMQSISRLLKPGGFVYIDTPNVAKYTRRMRLLMGKFPSTAAKNEGLTTFSGDPVDLHDEGHLHYFTYRSLSLMLTERCGFSRIVKLPYPGGRAVFGTHIHMWLARLWPEMFSELALIAYR
ncbi:MAG: class I SAM-dependent methyltransferase, partial [Candidatus Hydrogenedentes bacterium]|nr:class I SAM-dependent methyltransferase [Candidatus Hydrogenedentota bacterium]